MNYPYAAFLCQCYRQLRFGNGVHSSGDNRDIYRDVIGQLRTGLRLARHKIALGRYQQHIVESYTFSNNFALVHFSLQITLLRAILNQTV